METHKRSEYEAHGIPGDFVQDNQSLSAKGVLRGLHFQAGEHAQGRLVRVLRGAVWDAVVDLRRESSTFGKWFGLELSAENRTQLYIPPGFAHGFLTLSDEAELFYKCTCEYHRPSERGIRWDDPALAIGWPTAGLTIALSERDAALPSWNEFLRDRP